MTPNLLAVMLALYASEINIAVSCFWDGGWDVKLGDNMNGFKAEKNFDDLDSAAPWLIDEAKRLYPTSEFAKAW